MEVALKLRLSNVAKDNVEIEVPKRIIYGDLEDDDMSDDGYADKIICADPESDFINPIDFLDDSDRLDGEFQDSD